MKKRFWALFLAVMMVVSVLPTSAFAAEEETPAQEIIYGEYVDGEWVPASPDEAAYSGEIYYEEHGITLSKKAEKVDENTYEITLEVVTTATTVAAPAAVVLVMDASSSMDSCANCGSRFDHEYGCQQSLRKTRMEVATAAAKDFLDAYCDAPAGSGRYLSIVVFSDSASPQMDWYDVSTTDGYNAAVEALEIEQDSGTNLEDGLYAANVKLSEEDVADIEHKFVIALTDGAPTRSGRVPNKITNNWGSQAISSATENTADTLKRNAKLYTICFGAAGDDTFTPAGGSTTVGNFLSQYVAAEGCAYTAANTEGLYDAFDAITKDVVSGLAGAEVDDPMGEVVDSFEITFGDETAEGNGKINWELGEGEGEEGEDGVTVYTYTLTYQITLNSEDYLEDSVVIDGEYYYPTNLPTTLTIPGADGDIVLDFPIPAVLAPTCTVVYDEGAHGTIEDEDAKDGKISCKVQMHKETPSAPEVTPAEGYEFIGWKPEVTKTVEHDVRYVAQYEPVKYTVTYHDNVANENIYVLEPQTKTHDVDYRLWEMEPERTGYKFLGWNTDPDGEGTSYEVGATYTGNADLDLYAQWDAKIYDLTINYEYADGSEAADTYEAEVAYGEAYEVASPVIAGYTADIEVVEGAMPDKDVTVTVTYTANINDLTINYVYADGTEAAEIYEEEVAYGEAYEVASPVIAGYTADILVVEGTMPAKDVEVTVTYTANDYNLTINYEYADGSEAADTYEAEVAYGAEYSVGSPVIEGYTASLEVVEGTMPAKDVTVTVTYTANMYDYTVEYYYDRVIDGSKTVLASAEYGSQITTYEDKCIENYKLDKVEGLPMTITEIATNNRIQVYYVMKNTDVIVNKDVISVTSSSDQPAEAAEEEETKWTAKVGDTITWSIKVENKGNVEQTLTLEDILSNGEDVTVVDADGNAVTTFTLAEGESVEFTATYVVKAEDKGKELVNTAVIKDGDQKKDEDPAPSVVVDDPKVSITKTADKTAVKVGDKVTYTIVVENKGNVELTGVKVTDTFVAGGKGKLTVKSGNLEIGTLAVGETATIVLEYVTVADDVKGLENSAVVETNETEDAASAEEVAVTKKNEPIPPVGPSKPALNKADHYAYVVGYPDGLVHPEKNITRAEVSTIFFRMLLDESREDFWAQENWFSDVPADQWYNNAVSTLANAGLISGYPDGSFKPNANITRAEFATIAIRFFLEEDVEITENNLSDVKGHWAEANINLAYALNLINGYPDGTFRPDQKITRAEAMTIVNRVLERTPDKDHLLEDMIEWPDNMDKDMWYYADVQEATNSHEFYKTKDQDTEEVYEIWTELLPVRDWVALEQMWSQSNSSKNPGEVVDINVTTP